MRPWLARLVVYVAQDFVACVHLVSEVLKSFLCYVLFHRIPVSVASREFSYRGYVDILNSPVVNSL